MERKLLAILVLILIASLAVCGCVTSTTNTTQSNTQSDKTTFSSNRGYTITYPQEWVRDTSANALVEAYLFPNPNNAIDAVDVGTQKLNTTTGTTLDGFFNNNMGNGVTGVSSYQGYAFSSFEQITLAGQPADKVVWQATVPEKISATNSQLAPLKAMQVYLIHNGTGYVITYKATPSDYDTYLAQAQDVINSFQLTSTRRTV